MIEKRNELNLVVSSVLALMVIDTNLKKIYTAFFPSSVLITKGKDFYFVRCLDYLIFLWKFVLTPVFYIL